MREDPRRQSTRKSHLSEVHIDGVRDTTDPIRMSDLSTKGVFLDTRCVIAAGSTVQLSFRIAGHPVSVAARVVYCTPPFGMGVEFLDLSPEDCARIELVRPDALR
jgi:Tfp pilus assembly protein PilZ